MKPVRWTGHALESLTDRQVDRAEAERALEEAERRIEGRRGRQMLLHRYQDQQLRQPMLLCLVVEDRPREIVVVTVYRTSKLGKYLEGGTS